MDTHDFSGLPPAAQAYIRELEQGTADLAPRIQTLEEQLGLAQSQRFAPRSEKLKDRVFNEAEQMAQAYDDADDAFALPDTGLPQVNEPEGGKRGRKPLSANLPPQRIEYDVPEDQKICACCGHGMHRMGEDNSEQLHIEVKASVLQQVWFKYACRHCERHADRTPVLIASMPAGAAGQQCQRVGDRHRHGRQVCRRYAAVPDGRRICARRHSGRPRHTGQLDHPARRAALQPPTQRCVRRCSRSR
ncbi:IS66 family transposase zinc-finger binding domain-containing protein [Paraburkholderia youngii]|uniref:IS66 family transposase zinc-finger binding domain-containing protein n=1 Tax=Paraburkholderia youngii TaxID=2782701 RepID=UPI003D22FC7E